MAGAGFKTFNTGDVLTASDVNTYLMQQTVMVFDDASARSTALPTPSEGMFSYLKDTNLTYRYDGSAWLSDAGTTSPLTTKGDVWGYSTTDARIPVGANGTVLTADSAEALGVKWAAAAGGGKVLQVVHSSYSTEVTTTSATYADTGLTATITPTANTSNILIIVMHNGIMNNQSIADKWATFRLMKSTTELTEYEKLAAYSSTTARLSSNTSGLTYLDSPATTSATTYKTQIATNGTGGHLVQYGGSRSTICLMEIGA